MADFSQLAKQDDLPCSSPAMPCRDVRTRSGQPHSWHVKLKAKSIILDVLIIVYIMFLWNYTIQLHYISLRHGKLRQIMAKTVMNQMDQVNLMPGRAASDATAYAYC